jgi:hypothetical protein
MHNLISFYEVFIIIIIINYLHYAMEEIEVKID